MSMHFVLAPQAALDLVEIWRYIKEQTSLTIGNAYKGAPTAKVLEADAAGAPKIVEWLILQLIFSPNVRGSRHPHINCSHESFVISGRISCALTGQNTHQVGLFQQGPENN